MNHMTLRLACFASCAALAASVALPAAAFPSLFDTTAVLEYVNDYTGHYFLAADASDEHALDSGAAGQGWHRTGYRFTGYVAGSPRGQDVCRFYDPSPNSHFFTASAYECGLLQAHPDLGWLFEGVKFREAVPVDGICPAEASQPIHRLYNNRFQFNDSSHRFVFDDGVRADMVARGWIDEGVALCTEGASDFAVKSFTVATADGIIRPVSDCENEDVTQGSCIGMNGLIAGLTTQIDACAPNAVNCSIPGPFWTQAFGALTGASEGVGETLFTAQPPYATQAILEHSFVQESSNYIGAHVASADSGGALASIEPMYQLSTRAPAAGAADARVFPWRFARDNHIDLTFLLSPETVRRADASSHGYGAPMIEFRDVTSGASIDVTMLTYGTIPPGDFVGAIDPRTPNVYVSTTMGAKTLFGTTLKGDFLACAGDGPCATTSSTHANFTNFGFRITVADFAKILALARGSNPALSANPADYLLVNFRFRNGILGTADVGATLLGLSLGVYGY